MELFLLDKRLNRKEEEVYMKRYRLLGIVVVVVLALCLVAGCSSKDERMPNEAVAPGAPNAGAVQGNNGENNSVVDVLEESKTNSNTGKRDSTIQVPGQDTDRKLTYIVDLSMETYEYEKDYNGFYTLLKSKNGFVYSEDSSGTPPQKYGDAGRYTWITVKVPTENLDAFLSGLSENYSVTSKTISMEDFTDKYFDVETRISLLEQQYGKYEGYLEKAVTIEEILQLEDAMSDILYELDTLKGSKRSMDDKVVYSTVNVTLDELVRPTDVEPKKTKTFGDRIADAFNSTLEGLGDFFESFAVFIVGAAPVLIILAVIGLIVLIIYKGIKRKREKQMTPPTNVNTPEQQ